MKKRIVLLVLACIMTLSMLTGCNKDKYQPNTDLTNISSYDYTKFYGQNITINVANWGEYMAVNDTDYLDVNKSFEKLTGIKVNYKTCSTNEELYAKLKSGGADYDVIVPSDYMISRMIKENMIQKLDFDNIPNNSLINEKFDKPVYDPTNDYSVPYMWGIVCLIYNKKMIKDKIDSWDALWDKKYKNNILMFNNPKDAFGIALLKNGYSLNSENKDELKKAAESLKEQKSVVQSYVMDEIFDKMEGGSAAIAPYYAGDAITMMAENPDLTYAIPKEGTNRFVDAACIPTVSKNKEAAEMYINFLNEPEIAYVNCDYTGYSTPNDGAFNLLDDEVKNNPLQYPDDDYLKNKAEFFNNLSDDTNDYTQKLWNEIKIKSDSTGGAIIVIFLILSVIATIYINVRRIIKKNQDVF